jgi:signal transduction histidine kinase
MEALIDALLALSRVGRHELHRRPVDLAALARAAFAELQPAIGARRIELAVGPMPTVAGVPLLRELFDNLLANAVKVPPRAKCPTSGR